MRECVTHQLAGAGLSVDPPAAGALAEFLGELSKWNRVHNLTAVTEPAAMVRRHVVESLALRTFLRGSRVADVGSGAGAPGIPLAIAEPQRQFTLIESRGKRAAFLRHVQGRLGLTNVAVEHGRVEDMNDARPFDTVLARAVASPPELLRLTERLFGPDTVLLAPVGERAAARLTALDERFEARRVDGVFGGSLAIIRKSGG